MAKETEFPEYETLTNPRKRSPGARARSEELSVLKNSSGTKKHHPEPISELIQRSSNEGERLQSDSNGVADPSHRFLKRGHAISFLGLLLFTGFVYFRPYEMLPGLSFLSSGAKWIAALTLLVFVPTQLGLEGNLTRRPREVNLVLLLALTALLSLPMAISISEAWDNLTEYLKVVAMFIVMVNVVRTERRLRWMFWLAVAVSFTTSIGAINDYRAGNLLLGGERIKGIIGGLFENPNDLALHLVTVMPLAVGLCLYRSNSLLKIVYAVAAVLMVLAIICTFSRAGFLGLIAAAFVLAWKFGRKSRLTVTVVSLLVILAFIALAPAEYGGRLTSIWSGDVSGSVSARQDLFWRSVIVALRYPFFGVGIGNFHFKSIQEQVSHNSYTQVASELGMAASVFYVLFMLAPLKKLRRIENKARGQKEQARFYYLAVGLQASIIGYMVSSYFASVAFQWYIYYIVGYAVCLGRLYGPVLEVAQQESPAELKQVWLESSRQKVEPI